MCLDCLIYALTVLYVRKWVASLLEKSAVAALAFDAFFSLAYAWLGV